MLALNLRVDSKTDFSSLHSTRILATTTLTDPGREAAPSCVHLSWYNSNIPLNVSQNMTFHCVYIFGIYVIHMNLLSKQNKSKQTI